MSGEIVLKTLGGVALNPGSGEYTSCAMNGVPRLGTAERKIDVVPRSGRWPVFVAALLEGRRMSVKHGLGGAAGVGGAHEANLLLLKGRFYGPYATSGTLVFTDGDGIDKRLSVASARLQPLQDLARGAVLGEWEVLDAVALAEAASSVTAVAKTSSPATLSVPNAGNVSSHSASLTLRPTVAKSAANGQRYCYRITPLIRTTAAMRAWPVDITDGGWDHAAEVTASRSTASGNDVEVLLNGVRLPRWPGIGTATWNNTGTKIWINLDHPPARYWTLKVAAGSSDTTITVEEDLVAMPTTPFYAVVDEGSREVIRVTAYDAVKRQLTIVRTQRGSTNAAISAAVKIYHAPLLVDLVYGWTSAPAPNNIDDDFKPVFLSNASSNSANTAFVFEVFQETEAAASTQARKPRSASWFTQDFGKHDREKLTGQGDMYWQWVPRTATLSTDATPASKMCIAYRAAGAFGGHPLVDRWAIISPVDVASVEYTHTASSIGTGSGVREGKLEVRFIDADGIEVLANRHNLDDYAPGNGTATVTVDGSQARAIMFAIAPYDPKLDSTVNQTAAQPAENDGFTIDDVTLTFNTGTRPAFVRAGSRSDIYQIGRPDTPATLANSAGDTLSIYGLVVDLSTTVTIDVDAQTVTISTDSTKHNHLVSGTIPMLPVGTNNLTYTESGIGTVEMGVSSFRSAWV